MRPPHCPANATFPALTAIVAFVALAVAHTGASAIPLKDDVLEGPTDLTENSEIGASQLARAMTKTRRPKGKARQAEEADVSGGDEGDSGGQTEMPFKQLSDSCAVHACKQSRKDKCPAPPAGFVTTRQICNKFKKLIDQTQKGTPDEEIDEDESEDIMDDNEMPDMGDAMDMDDSNLRGIRALDDAGVPQIVRKLIELLLDSYLGPLEAETLSS